MHTYLFLFCIIFLVIKYWTNLSLLERPKKQSVAIDDCVVLLWRPALLYRATYKHVMVSQWWCLYWCLANIMFTVLVLFCLQIFYNYIIQNIQLFLWKLVQCNINHFYYTTLIINAKYSAMAVQDGKTSSQRITKVTMILPLNYHERLQNLTNLSNIVV